MAAPSPRIWGEGNNERSYLEGMFTFFNFKALVNAAYANDLQWVQEEIAEHRFSSIILSTYLEQLLPKELNKDFILEIVLGISMLDCAGFNHLVDEIPHRVLATLIMKCISEYSIPDFYLLFLNLPYLPLDDDFQLSCWLILNQRLHLLPEYQDISWTMIHQILGYFMLRFTEPKFLDRFVPTAREDFRIGMIDFYEQTQINISATNPLVWMPDYRTMLSIYAWRLKVTIQDHFTDSAEQLDVKISTYCHGYWIDLSIEKNGQPFILIQSNTEPFMYARESALRDRILTNAGYVLSNSLQLEVDDLVPDLPSPTSLVSAIDLFLNPTGASFERGLMRKLIAPENRGSLRFFDAQQSPLVALDDCFSEQYAFY